MRIGNTVEKCQERREGLLPILKAIATGREDVVIAHLEPTTLNRAIEAGLGPYVAYIAHQAPLTSNNPSDSRIRAADLTVRLLAAEILAASRDILGITAALGHVPVLIKGIATARRYYPLPHLRMMGDIDIYVAPHVRPALERELLKRGLEQHSTHPAEFFDAHHHSIPFWHPRNGVWIEVHHRLFPPTSPLANSPTFAIEQVTGELRPMDFEGVPALVMSDELQLVYTSARWAEGFDQERGIFPLLDAMLLLARHGPTLDWEKIERWVRESGAGGGLRLILQTLSSHNLASVPVSLLHRLAVSDRYTNRLSQWILRRIVYCFLIERRSFGRLITANTVGIVWSTLLRPHHPWRNLLALPGRILFPPQHPRRFHPALMYDRLRWALFGARPRGRMPTEPEIIQEQESTASEKTQ